MTQLRASYQLISYINKTASAYVCTKERKTIEEYNLIGCSCNWHWNCNCITLGKSQPHILLLMFQWKSRGVIVLDHSGSFQLEHWVSNSTQILPENNLWRINSNTICQQKIFLSYQYIKKSLRVQSTSVGQYKSLWKCIHHTEKEKTS